MRYSLVFGTAAAVAAVMAAWSDLASGDNNHNFVIFAVAALVLGAIAKGFEYRETRLSSGRHNALLGKRHGDVIDGQGAIHADVRAMQRGVETLVERGSAVVTPTRIGIAASLGNPVILLGGSQHHRKAWYHLTIHNDGGKSSFRVAIAVYAPFSDSMLVTGQQSLWWNSEEESKSLMQGEEADIELGYVERSAPDNRVVYMEIGCDTRGTRPSCWTAFPTESVPHPVVEFELLITADPQIEGGAQRHRFRIDGDGIRQLEPGTQPVRVGLRLRDMLSPPWRWPRN